MHHRRHLLTPASLPHHRTAGSYWCWWCWCVYLQQRENGLGGEQLRGDGVWVQVKQSPQAATGGIVQMQIRLYCVRHVFLFTLLLTIATIFYSSSSSSSSSSSYFTVVDGRPESSTEFESLTGRPSTCGVMQNSHNNGNTAVLRHDSISYRANQNLDAFL